MYEVTEKSTMHGSTTPHGSRTPHRYPTNGESLTDLFSNLITKLYPTGRAFYMEKNKPFDLLHQAINRSFIRVVQDARLTIEGVIPTSEEFSGDDALLWEYRLGLSTNLSLSLQDRKDAILRKMTYPNNIKARQHRLFIESQLQIAGFDVYVHENLPPYQTPDEVATLNLGTIQHTDNVQHGNGVNHGSANFSVIANYADVNEDFSIGVGNLWATFFIGGPTLGSMATVPQNRMIEFKELVLKLKPAHLVAFTFINFA